MRTTEHPAKGSVNQPEDQPLKVIVIYTDRRATLAALRVAARLASGLDGQIRIVLPSIVPYPLALQNPPVDPGIPSRRLRTLAGRSALPTTAEIIYCRDYADAARMLAPKSLAVMAAGENWWRPWSGTWSLARAIRRAGHHLIVI
jgi:hypothetical protein